MMAWLNATPKPPEGSKRAELIQKKKAEAPKLSRLAEMKRAKIEPAMPPNPLPHLVEWFIEMGMSEANGMGMSPISWREIDAWCHRTGIDLSPWEAQILRRLSVEYLAESRRAEDENCPSPCRTEVTQSERETEQARLEMVLG
jgi:hypothetical protein